MYHDRTSENLFVCPKCNHHHRIGSAEYFEILFDDNKYDVLFENIRSKDFLHFTDLKSYGKRLDEIWSKTDITDSIRIGKGTYKRARPDGGLYGFRIHWRLSG